MKSFLRLLIALGSFAALTPPALAKIGDVGPVAPTGSPALDDITSTTLGILHSINSLLLTISGGLAVIMLVVGGIYYISGQADTGKKVISTTIIGIAIVATYWAIMQFVVSFVPQ